MRRKIALGAVVTAAAAVLAVALMSKHGGAPASTGQVVKAERGEVAITVGGIGHITTLAGAARIAVAAPPSSGGAAGGGSGSGTGGGGAGSATNASSSGGSTQAPADAVFPAVAGHVSQLLVRTGDHVSAGQPIARLSDDGTTASNVLQARSDFDTAGLELAQKSVRDPGRGPKPTSAELTAGRQAVQTAHAKLQRVIGPPLPADVSAARSDLAKAVADLEATRDGTPAALTAADLAVTTAKQKLQLVSGAPDPAELAAAQLELAKATLDQETLFQTTPAPTNPARSAAQLAVDAAKRRLDQVITPPPAVVSAARQEVAKSEAELAALLASHQKAGLSAAQAAVTSARRKLAQVAGPQPSDVVSAARLDLRKAQADRAVLLQRGSPADVTDLNLARLKVDVGRQRLNLAQEMGRRLTVLAGSSGTVTSVLTTRGASVDPATPLVRVQDLSHLVVTLDLSEFDVGRTRVGAPARISVDAFGGKTFGGRVIDVALSGNDNGGVVNFPVIIALNSAGRLRPGMSVSARIVVTSHPNVVRIPLDAVRDQGGHPSVMVRQGTALTRRPVKLGLRGAQFVEVRSGLRTGERIASAAKG